MDNKKITPRPLIDPRGGLIGMKQARTLLFGLVLLLAGFGLAFAQGGGGHRGSGSGSPMRGDYGRSMGPGRMGGAPGMGDGMLDEDGLGPGGDVLRRGMPRGQRSPWGADMTPEQRERLQTARQEYLTATRPLRDQIREKEYALLEELNRQDPDEAGVDQLQQELTDLQRQFDQLQIQHRMEVSNILGADLTQEHMDRIAAERSKFFSETQEIRDAIREKRVELQKELARPNPEEEKALALQDEVSALRGRLDRRKIQHQLEIRKILPETAAGGANGAQG